MVKKTSFACFPNDESLQSYLFRTLKVNGFFDYSSILVPRVGWGSKPSLPYEARDIFSEEDKSYLLKRLEISTILSEYESDCSNHFDYVQSFDRTFFPQTKIKSAGKGIPIHYCPHCIEEQIYEYGFSYFKLCWQSQDYCFLHANNLLEINAENLTNLAKAINRVLRCEFSGVTTSHSKANLKNEVKVVSERSFKFAPCAKNSLLSWVVKNGEHYPIGYTDSLDYEVLTDRERQAFNLMKYREVVEENWNEFYQQLIESNYEDVLHFINENMVFELVSFLHNGAKSEQKGLLKSKTASCTGCMKHSFDDYLSCSKANLIYSSYGFFSRYPNICKSEYYEWEEKIDDRKSKLKIRQAELQVERDIEQSREYKKHGGKKEYNDYIAQAVDKFLF